MPSPVLIFETVVFWQIRLGIHVKINSIVIILPFDGFEPTLKDLNK